jgi:beta-N-acetylhexosaminidase
MVISDDLEMRGALNTTGDTVEAAEQALRAGNDLVLISHTPELQERTWTALRRRMDDPEFRARVREAAARVLTVKLRTFRAPAAVPLFPADDAASGVPVAEAAGFFLDSAARSVTAIRSAHIPFRPEPARRLLLVGQSDEFLREGLLRFPQADTYRFPYSPFHASRPSDRETVRNLAGAYDAIIFLLMNYNSGEVLADLSPYADRVLVVSALTPVYLADLPWVRTAVAVYGDSRDSYRAGLAVLAGDYHAEGRLPIDFGLADGSP